MKLKIKTQGKKIRLNYVEIGAGQPGAGHPGAGHPGAGQPIVFIHGWPLSHKMWEPQLQYFADQGFRSIAYDRRGFGDSDAPSGSYDYDVLAEDLHRLILELDLKKVILCGFSMGGGEVIRYLTNYGSDRIDKIVLMGSIIPLVKKTDDNPDGVPEQALEDILEALKNNRVPFLEEFGKGFLNYDPHQGNVSEAMLKYYFSIAAHASPVATLGCAQAWAYTDFRPELANVTVPALIIHGSADGIVPIKTSGDQAARGIKNSQYVVVADGPHGLNLTHRDEVNEAMVRFLK
ncbi:pimeloyl-ACP methyl ester carboxylesterase [Dyadobacter jejuensis]|uniref:Pimeloyl-ACP methyl ester carboxylesterase n=1 Tax=Dyadobacter jejuensis TaxID=1082580 RepID=A0A316ACT1_9BACT|nr:alpha/beta hydrolase [Dyadobacter jejuensis]PWJ55596.1 pimeloyl-ACP methyl ester carboxylesterase [Dyadobacter jejuensis]